MTSLDRIKQMCEKRDIAISRLERECGFSNGYIRGLKTGKIPSDRLQKIADYFGVSVEYLITGEQPEGYYLNEETAEIAQAIYDDPDLKALFSAARGTKPEDMKLAADMLRRFKETNPNG